jgi:hypothetical protein
MADPFAVLAWQTKKPIRLVPDGRTLSLNTNDEFYIDVPATKQGIYRCVKDHIDTNITPIPNTDPQQYDTSDFDSHIARGDFICLTATSATPPNKIDVWVKSKLYKLNDKVFLDTYYNEYYICVISSISQSIFNIYQNGEYPINENNEKPERVISGIRNEGWYLFPRGRLTELPFVPKWPGMIFISTDPDNRAIYAYTDGKGQFDGWDIYATATARGSEVAPGMIIGWLWSPVDPNNPPIPSGYLRCDEARVSQAQYSKLYAVIGDRYRQSGDPVDGMFRLPLAYNQIIFAGV